MSHARDDDLPDARLRATVSKRTFSWDHVTGGYALPNALPPFEGESLPSLVMRNAGKYQLTDPRDVLRRLSPPPAELYTLCRVDLDAPAGEAMRELLGVDQAAWQTLAMGAGASHLVRLKGHILPRELARLRQRHVCPQCLVAAPYHRSQWFIEAMSVCTDHRSKLLRDCPHCRRPLAWRGAGVHLCSNLSCHFDLRRASAEQVPEGELGGVRVLASLFNGQELPGFKGQSIPLGAALRFMIVFGLQDAGLSILGSVDSLVNREKHHIHEIVNRGWRALDDWPHGFNRLLDKQIALASSRPGKAGLLKLFGDLSDRIRAWQCEPWGRPIAQAFALYISSHPNVAIPASVLSRFSHGEDLAKRNLTLAEASRALELSFSTMIRLAKRKGLFLVAPTGGGVPSVLSSKSVMALRKELEDAIGFEEGRQLVGVGRPILLQIEKAGLIRRVAEDRVVDSQIFKRTEIHAFVTACRGTAPVMTLDEAKQAGLTTIRGMSRQGRSCSDICQALIEGRLHSRGLLESVMGLEAVFLDPNEVRKVLPTVVGLMSAVELGRHLRIHVELIRHWTSRGFLHSVSDASGIKAGLQYRMEDIDRFLKEFMPGGEVAQKTGTPGSGTSIRHLRFFGIRPVSGPTVDGSPGNLFRRADVTAEALTAIARQRVTHLTLRDKRAQSTAQLQAAFAQIQKGLVSTFKRANNRLEDGASGRIIQLISGRRHGFSEVYNFKLNPEALERLLSAPTAHVALVPDKGDTFVYAPLKEALTFATSTRKAIRLRFNAHGIPQALGEYAISLRSATPTGGRQAD